MEHITKLSSEIQLNKREALRCQREISHGVDVVRFLRMKPSASGNLRPVGPQLAFAAKHLADVIIALQALRDDAEGRA